MAQTTRSSSRAGHFERRWRRRARWAVAVCLVAGATAAGVVLSSTPGSPYRLARVTTGSPTAELTAVGTLVPVNQASVAFDEAGTVATVPVTVGEHVTAGQTLATLVPGPLQATEAQAQSQVASAQATLAAAEASESETSTPSAGSSATTAQELASAQTAVIADQRALDGAEHVAEVDLAGAEQVCGAAPLTTSATGQATGASSTGATGRSSTAFAPSTGGTSGTSGTGGTGGTSCANALGEVAHEQTAVAADTATLESDETALAGMLSRSTSTAGSGSGGAARTGAFPSGGSSTSPSANQSSGTTPASPQQLASDQAAVDVASAQLADAERAVGDATLTTPLTGTVAAVGLAPGQTISARVGGRSTAAASIVVIAPGSVDVGLAVPVADLAELAVGQHATVVPDATGTAVAATVTNIGLVATTSSSGVTTYPVTVTIAPGTGLTERTGGQASVAVMVGHATDVTVVPTSAVHRVGAVRTVDVDTAGTVSLVRITTGVVGARWTQVTAGVHRGQQVVLADLTAPLPTSTTGTRGLRALTAGVRVAGGASGRTAAGGKAPRGG
ncbi:MAG: HlyD family efflux transporter periplasmic adaptor subunit [Actinomycetota bacterium]|nr:HlyD family efflux transporter periplasmic adaptor subunit [Actinomycetota bacterium]